MLDECRVPGANLLGGEAAYHTKEGFMTAMKTFDNTRPIVAAMATGIGRAAYEHARDFVKEHYVMARPIPRYAAIAERLARVGRQLAAARVPGRSRSAVPTRRAPRSPHATGQPSVRPSASADRSPVEVGLSSSLPFF